MAALVKVTDLPSGIRLVTGQEFGVPRSHDAPGSPQVLVSRARLLTRRLPRNAFPWVDLARAYANAGLIAKSLRAMDVAVALQPTNRFVLRSASRLFIHAEDPERAFQLLRRSTLLRSDPWIASAEISTARIVKKSPGNIKNARSIAADSNLSTRSRSELNSAMGTLELFSGTAKPARRCFEASLADPTENSVAQAEWASRRLNGLDDPLKVAIERVPNSHEAQAGAHFRNAEFELSLAASLAWLEDQSFSARPAVNASFIAAEILGDFQLAIEVCERGLVANPRDVELSNNLAYALASGGRLQEAASVLDAMNLNPVDEEDRIALTATRGLVAFRLGNADRGKSFYATALNAARRKGLKRYMVLCALHWLHEEIRLGGAATPELLDIASSESEDIEHPEIPVVRRRLDSESQIADHG